MLKKVSFKTDPAFREFFNGRDDPALIRFSFLQNFPTEGRILKKLSNGRDDPTRCAGDPPDPPVDDLGTLFNHY